MLYQILSWKWKNKMRIITKTLFLFLFIALINESALAQTQSTYTVTAGDTFFSISRKLNVTVAELKNWNNLTSNTLSVGQQLVYFVDTPDSLIQAQPIEELVPEDTTSLVEIQPNTTNAFYLVKSGDSLYKIARDNGMTIAELKAINNLTSDNIRVGQRLAIRSIISEAPVVSEFSDESTPQGRFALYTLESADNLNSVLNRFKMTEVELRALNPDVDLDNLQLAKSVTVLLPPSRSFENPYFSNANLQDLGTVSVTVYPPSNKMITTTNGELYDENELTAAHSNIALGSIIFVENALTGQGIYVRINDRIPGTELKLSAKAFRILGFSTSENPTALIYIDG